MKNTVKVLTFLFGIALFTGCSPRLTPFTEDLYRDFKWTEGELKKVQFYLSQDVVLSRELTGGKSEIVSGKIKVEKGKKIEQVVIPKGTPGVIIDLPERDRFAVSFEADGNDRFLMFGPNPKAGDRYVLLASDWKRSYGKVTYGAKKYRVDSNDAYAALLVDLRKIQSVDRKSKVAKGRRVD